LTTVSHNATPHGNADISDNWAAGKLKPAVSLPLLFCCQ